MKAELRRVLLEKRRGASQEDRQFFTEVVCHQLVSLDVVQTAQVIVAYMAFDDELSVEAVIRWALDQGKRVALPCFRDGRYVLTFVTDIAQCVVGRYGILEPPADAVVLTDKQRNAADLWLVPGVGFTQDGKRLGYGKGVYDRLLEGVSGYKIGVGFPFQMVDFLPVDAHDIGMDLLVKGQ